MIYIYHIFILTQNTVLPATARYKKKIVMFSPLIVYKRMYSEYLCDVVIKTRVHGNCHDCCVSLTPTL